MQLETERLILRRFEEKDREPFFAINSDPEVTRYFLNPLTKEENDQLLEKIHRYTHERGYSFLAAELKETGELIGMIGLNRLFTEDFSAPFLPAVEVGWRLARPHWGKGYATEGAKACLHYAFTHLSLPEVVAFTAAANIPSQKVMERLGMVRDEKGDFHHTKLPKEHPLAHHYLYRTINEIIV